MVKNHIELGGKEDVFSAAAKIIFDALATKCKHIPLEQRRIITSIVSFYEIEHCQNDKTSNTEIERLERASRYAENITNYFNKNDFSNDLEGWINILITAIGSNDSDAKNLEKIEEIELDDQELHDIIIDGAIVEIQRKLTQTKTPGLMSLLRKKLHKLTKSYDNHDLVALNNVILNIDQIAAGINHQIQNPNYKNPSKKTSKLQKFFQKMIPNFIRNNISLNNKIINSALKKSLPSFQFFRFINKKIFPEIWQLTKILASNRLRKKKAEKGSKIAVKKHIKQKRMREQLYHMLHSHNPESYIKLPTTNKSVVDEFKRLSKLGMSKSESAAMSVESHAFKSTKPSKQNSGHSIS